MITNMTQYELFNLKDMASEQGKWAIRWVNETEYWVPEALPEIDQTDLVNIQSEYAGRMVELEKRYTPQEAERMLWDEMIQNVKQDRRCLSTNNALEIWYLRIDGAPIGEILLNVEEIKRLNAYEALIEDKIRFDRPLRKEEMEYVMELDEDSDLRQLMSEKEQMKKQNDDWALYTPEEYYELFLKEINFTNEEIIIFIESKKKAILRAMGATKPEPGTSLTGFMKALKLYKRKLETLKKEYDFWNQVIEILNHINRMKV